MRLSDEQLADIINSDVHHITQELARDLLSARKVVEAARKLVSDADPVRLASGCRTGVSTVWDEHIEGIRAALASHGGEQKPNHSATPNSSTPPPTDTKSKE